MSIGIMEQINKRMQVYRIMSTDVELTTTSEHPELSSNRALLYKFHEYIFMNVECVRCQMCKIENQLM